MIAASADSSARHVSAGIGSPAVRQQPQPIAASVNSHVGNAAARTGRQASTISGPMPSPGNNTMRCEEALMPPRIGGGPGSGVTARK